MSRLRAAQPGRRELRDSRSRFDSKNIALAIIGVLLHTVSLQADAVDLTSVVVRGSTVYTAPELFDVYRERLGQPIDRASARAIVDALTAKYAADGYSPPQVRVDDALVGIGVLRVDVLEPRIAEISVTGNPGPHRERIEHLAQGLRADGPLTQSGVQTALRRMRELPGLSLSASTARDAEQPNVYRLDLDTEFEPVTGAVRLTNRGTEEAGPNFVLGQVMVNGLLAGQTNVGVMFGAATDYDEYHGLGLLSNVGIDAAGARLSFTGFRSRSNPHEPIVDRDDIYLRDRVTLGYTRPFSSVSRATVTLTAMLDLDDLSIARSGSVLRDERLRLLDVGSAWRWRSGATQYAWSTDLIKGLDAWNSGLTARDLIADRRRADFTLMRSSLTRLTRFGQEWSMRIDGLIQHTAYVLPYGQRFKIGGDRLGRGFEVAEIAGDQGLGAKLEGRRLLPRAPTTLGRVSVYGFYDIGAAWKQDVPGRESAATAGFGFGTQSERVSGSLELAKPLTHADVEGRKRLALFAEVSVLL